jgi:protein TonB
VRTPLTIISFAVFSLLAAANPGKVTRIWLDQGLKACDKKSAHFYMEPAGKDDSTYKALIYDKEGRLKAEGHFADESLTIEHGLFTFYYADGKVESTGNYEMGHKSGVWQRFDTWGRELAEKVYNPDPLRDILYTQAETMPKYPGGQHQLVTYLKKSASGNDGVDMHGTMTASFVVEPTGELSEVKVLGAANELIEERVAAALKDSPPWTPGEQDGLPVRVKVQVPVPY